MDTLDNIMSGNGEATPAPETPAPKETTQQPAEQAIPAKAAEPTEDEGAIVQPDGRKMVPLEALTESRGKVKRYTEQVADFERKLNDQNTAWERRFGQLLETVKPAAPQPQQPAPDFFENPNAAVLNTVAPYLERLEQSQMHNSQLIAGNLHGADKVKEAEDAFVAAVQGRTLDPADYQRVVNSPNRYAAAVQWHKRTLAQQEIGDDPAAYKERLRTELLAELQQGQPPANNGAPAAPVIMPSNLAGARNVGSRAGPAWSGPTPINDIFDRKRPA